MSRARIQHGVLLVGDSLRLERLLDQKETIDACMERWNLV